MIQGEEDWHRSYTSEPPPDTEADFLTETLPGKALALEPYYPHFYNPSCCCVLLLTLEIYLEEHGNLVLTVFNFFMGQLHWRRRSQS